MPWRGGLAGLRAGDVIRDEPHPYLALLICGESEWEAGTIQPAT